MVGMMSVSAVGVTLAHADAAKTKRAATAVLIVVMRLTRVPSQLDHETSN